MALHDNVFLNANEILTISLICIGGCLLLLGIHKTGQLRKVIPESKYAKIWSLLRYFMLFFFFGYTAALIGIIKGYTEIIQVLIGVIFLLGAAFVLIVVIIGIVTIKDLKSILLSKEEKEVMLKEIHHRVKNNLQIVSSLLSLQKTQIESEQTRAVFDECQDRIYAMALMHEQLYGSNDLAKIDLKEYVKQLSEHLIKSYGRDNAVKVTVNSQVYRVHLDTLIPLGLILNELLSNTMKYAFEDQEGEVNVDLIHKDNNCNLIFSDNGIGYSKERFENDENTLGLQLVKILAEQMDGEINKLESKGAKYELIFPFKV